MTPRKLFKAVAGITLAGAFLLGTLGGAAARDLTGGKTTMAKSLDFTQVRITDTFWRARQEQFLCVTVPAGIANVEKAGGGISNLINAAKHNRGEACDAFEGALYVDSDVHKLVESMCYALQLTTDGNAQMQQAQEQIRAKLETWIGYYQGAQEADGYFDTYFTLAHPDEKFTDFNLHELYCAGHLYEAAVAHCRMTGGADTRLLDVAIRNADYLCSLFGVGKWKAVPGHQEIELALLKLANLCRELGGTYAAKADAYTELASFFLRTRGDQEGRHGVSFWPEGCQDYAPITEQAQLLSHCVRAHYMCTAMADLELQIGSGVYTETLKRFWTSAQTKTYVTGAVGDQDHHEGYGPDYYMPISKSYGETCGSVSSIMWNQRMNLLFGESKYADEMELQLYNSMLSGVSLDGDRFFYHNLVSTAGRERVEWYGTACCPPNLMRTVLSLGGYVYTQQADTVTMNLYVGNEADLSLSQGNAHLSVTSGFPWDGRVTIRLQADGARSMKLRLRIPDWAKGVNTLLLNGSAVSIAADAQGYAVLDRVWQNGDTLTLELPMQVQSIDMVEGCRDTEDYTAFRRGPIVYCAEAVDNAASPTQYYLSPDAAFTEAWTDNLDGKADTYGTRGMMTLTTLEAHLSTLEESETVPLKLIPFYANSNRGSTAMEAYLSLVPKGQRLEFYAEPSASHTFDGNEFDSVTHLNDNDESPESRWSSYNGSDVLPNPWVMYTFKSAVTVSGCRVLWYDDGGGVQVPNSLTIEYWDGEQFVPVTAAQIYTDFPKNSYGEYRFSQISTTKLRMTMHNDQSGAAAGIVEWRLIGTCESVLDMQQLPEDLFATGLADSYFPGNVGALRADGKGVNGSAALAYVYKNKDGGNYWGNSISLTLSSQEGLKSDWSGAKVLWLWVDSSEFRSQLSLDLWLNQVKPSEGGSYYFWSGSPNDDIENGGALPLAYTGADYGRLPLPVGYRGFVGISLDAFHDLDLSKINSFYFYFECEQDTDVLPKSLYLDEFWVTDAGVTPAITVERQTPAYFRMLWDMEALPDDLVGAGRISTWGSYHEKVEAVRSEGKGADGTTAFGYRYNSCTPGAGGSDILLIDNAPGLGASSDFSGGELLWFWLDTSEMPAALRFELYLNWTKLKTGAPVLLFNGTDAPTRLAATPAWGGQPNGRIDLPLGYVGYVGLRLKDFCTYDDQGAVTGTLDPASVTSILLYYGSDMDNDKLPATLYLDNFCLTDSGSLPGCKHAQTVTKHAKAATCTQRGYSGDEICIVCGKTVAEGLPIEALEHDWDEGTVTQLPTYTEPGVRFFTCRREGCNATKNEPIDKLIHEHSYGDYLHNSEAHWRECTSADCPDANRGRTEAEPHVYDNEQDAQCNVCGYERTPEPEKPDPEKPDPGKPDPEKPDSEKPDPEKPEPGKPEAEKPDTPPTGDRFPLWPMLLALSAMLLALLFPIRKKA